jgi:hypothetical protein
MSNGEDEEQRRQAQEKRQRETAQHVLKTGKLPPPIEEAEAAKAAEEKKQAESRKLLEDIEAEERYKPRD